MASRLCASRETTVSLEYELFEPIKLLGVWSCCQRGSTVSTCFIVTWVRNVARLMSQVHGDADWRDQLAAGVEAETCDKLSRKEQTNSGHYRRGAGPPNATSQLERN